MSPSTKEGHVARDAFQYPPFAESKLVRCTRGGIIDIIVDLRPESSTYLDHVAVELTADNCRSLYVPERFAHGYQVLEDSTEIVTSRRILCTIRGGRVALQRPTFEASVAISCHRDLA